MGAGVQRDDGGLVEDDALAARVDERVGGAEVDGEVASSGVAPLDRPEMVDGSHRLRGRPHPEPPSQCSCFQIGTVSFSVSMQKRAASKASARCGDDTTTATDASENSRWPIRCSSAIRSLARPLRRGRGGDLRQPRRRLSS